MIDPDRVMQMAYLPEENTGRPWLQLERGTHGGYRALS
jgi:hypothetical protein